MADIARKKTLATSNLKKLGISSIGAQQVLSGKAVTSQKDRDLLAQIMMVDHSDASKPVARYNFENAWPSR